MGMDKTQTVIAAIPVWNEDAHTLAPALASCKPLHGAFRFVGDMRRFGTHHALRQYALERARDEFGADWLVQMDADERLCNGDKLVDYLQTYPGFAYPMPMIQDSGETSWAPFRCIRTDVQIVSRCEYVKRNGTVWCLTGYAAPPLDSINLDEPYVFHNPGIRPPERRDVDRLSVIEMETDPPPDNAKMYFPPSLGGTMSEDTTPLEHNESGEVTNTDPYYCPACGLRYGSPGDCSGSAESGHEPTPVEKTKKDAPKPKATAKTTAKPASGGKK